MKPIRMLFIFLIGMISLTAFSATPEPEQKSTANFAEPEFQVINLVTVAHQFEVTAISESVQIVLVKQLKTENLVNPVCTAKDVGWPESLKEILDYCDVKVYNFHGSRLKIPISDLPRGMYIITSSYDNHQKQYLAFKEKPHK